MKKVNLNLSLTSRGGQRNLLLRRPDIIVDMIDSNLGETYLYSRLTRLLDKNMHLARIAILRKYAEIDMPKNRMLKYLFGEIDERACFLLRHQKCILDKILSQAESIKDRMSDLEYLQSVIDWIVLDKRVMNFLVYIDKRFEALYALAADIIVQLEKVKSISDVLYWINTMLTVPQVKANFGRFLCREVSLSFVQDYVRRQCEENAPPVDLIANLYADINEETKIYLLVAIGELIRTSPKHKELVPELLKYQDKVLELAPGLLERRFSLSILSGLSCCSYDFAEQTYNMLMQFIDRTDAAAAVNYVGTLLPTIIICDCMLDNCGDGLDKVMDWMQEHSLIKIDIGRAMELAAETICRFSKFNKALKSRFRLYVETFMLLHVEIENDQYIASRCYRAMRRVTNQRKRY